MGFENEWGSVDYNEIKPYIISEAKGTALDEVMAPAGYVWEDEDDEWSSARLLPVCKYGIKDIRHLDKSRWLDGVQARRVRSNSCCSRVGKK